MKYFTWRIADLHADHLSAVGGHGEDHGGSLHCREVAVQALLEPVKVELVRPVAVHQKHGRLLAALILAIYNVYTP